MKQVIFFHPYFSDGGVERTNLGIAKGLIENGYKVIKKRPLYIYGL